MEQGILLVHEPDRLREVARLFNEIWRAPDGRWIFAPDLLRSLAHAGGAVHAAYEAGSLAGASVAVFGPANTVYSLVAGVRAPDRGIGYALKQAQRRWALGHGATVMRWTFDPLVGRNARFNLMKLGATAVAYSVDFYGPMDDGVQGMDETDRLTVQWRLDTDSPRPEFVKSGEGVWCQVPRDIVELRRTDPASAGRWRVAVREVMVPAFANGFVATGMTRDGWYRLEKST
ncbi:chorismate synthase [Allorhizocola rhizosphaerae]|uniref:chorismate synthase n=1 Tax=Allorhizocola rhizosphaerae TaxID=1872709 RepID=UPI000E3DA583|nr:chorismate synthase [Allorhizocola rhizosphaerae]